MRAWTQSALRQYYLDPPVVFLGRGANKDVEVLIVAAGFYISPHCDPDCCSDLGISMVAMGPFRTAVAARKWSRDNLVAGVDRS